MPLQGWRGSGFISPLHRAPWGGLSHERPSWHLGVRQGGRGPGGGQDWLRRYRPLPFWSSRRRLLPLPWSSQGWCGALVPWLDIGFCRGYGVAGGSAEKPPGDRYSLRKWFYISAENHNPSHMGPLRSCQGAGGGRLGAGVWQRRWGALVLDRLLPTGPSPGEVRDTCPPRQCLGTQAQCTQPAGMHLAMGAAGTPLLPDPSPADPGQVDSRCGAG